MKHKRLVVISDLHCGHLVGLTPKKYHTTNKQALIWNFYEEAIKKLQPIDIIVCNGDAIDGIGKKTGGTELITTDRNKQVDLALECIDLANAKKKFIIAGTGYHVGSGEDFEEILADKLNAKFSGHEWLEINGKIFDFKHKVGSSTIPHGRHTAIAKEAMWNKLWHLDDGAPLSDVLIRSHVHFFKYAGDKKNLYITTPALQVFGSKYGVRQCSGIVDIGFISFDIYEDGTYDFNPHLFGEVKKIAPKAFKC